MAGETEMKSQSFRTRAALILATIALVAAGSMASAQTFTTLYNLDGSVGLTPQTLIQAIDGNLYGAAGSAGAYNGGTVFKLIPGSNPTVIYNFCAQSGCPDGEFPNGLTEGVDGNFYGTTQYGGLHPCGIYCGGTVFKLTAKGRLTSLYSFCSQSGCTDGFDPRGVLVQTPDGNFYGTTAGGGAYGYGTVFKITPKGNLTTIHSFCRSGWPCSVDGDGPTAGLIQASDGYLYGTTNYGGISGCPFRDGCGTFFQITPKGKLTTLYHFCSLSDCSDGGNPSAALVQAADGDFYGTTQYGGPSNDGTVFKITSTGMLTTLYSFCSQSSCSDGEWPIAALIQATDGNLYGTTNGGGSYFWGSLFTITPAGILTTLHSFDHTDGAYPYVAAPVQATNGTLYGATVTGGLNGDGTLYSLTLDLGPFVKTQTASGKVGSTVKILGTDMTGATSVIFNGIAATFTVVSSSLIKATVPPCATTGLVTVTTPGGILTSNQQFWVRP